jgi:metal-responsive CopG/Arc/MetJ family transcriptional regulator
MKVYSIRLPDGVMPKVNEFAREAGVSQSAAIRMLVQRSLGVGIARLLVDEKVLATNIVIQKRLRVALEGFRADLHAAIDGGFSTPTEDDDEPEVAPTRGRAPAKARKR